MKSKKLITSLLTISMLASTVIPAFAVEPNEVIGPLSGTGNSKITIEVKDTSGGGGTDPDDPDKPPVDPTDIIIATVPIDLPIIMDLDGNITVPTDAKIINHSTEKGIKVSKVSITLDPRWTAANYTDDFTAMADDTKEIGLSFRGDTLKADGTFTVTDGNWNIAKDNNLPLNMVAKLPKQTTESKTQAATVSFTIDWSGLNGADDESDPDAGKGDTGDSGEVNPPIESTVTVTFTADSNGSLDGDTTTTVNSGETVIFPTAKPSSIRYEHTGWIDTATNTQIEPTTPIKSDTTIKAVFSERAASPKNWFTTNGTDTITGLSAEYLNMVDAPTDLVIPKTIGGSTIKAVGSNAFANKDLITSIVIPKTITSIAADSFSGCASLTELNLDYSQPYAILNSPFGLTKDKIIWGTPEAWDTNPRTSSEIATLKLSFDKSTGTIRALDTTVSSSIALPTSVDGIKVTTVGNNAFFNCNNLTSITIPNSVTTIGDGAFKGCTGLTSIAIPDSITTISDNTFYGCTNLTSITIPSSVTTIGGGAFESCTGLTSITIPNSVTTIGGNTFYRCTNLTNITIPNSVTTIGGNAFGSCTGLTSITIPDSVTTIGDNAFIGCFGLTNINVEKNNSNYTSENGALFNKDKTTLVAYSIGRIKISYTIPNSVTTIGDNVFNSCTNLTSITIPSSVTTIGSGAFKGCTGLTSITIPNSVTTVGGNAFGSCTNLTSITIPDSVTTIGWNAFYNVPHITYYGKSLGSPWGALSIN